jgi:hypothetical protein
LLALYLVLVIKAFTEGEAAKLGFPPDIYSHKSSYKFYADTCVKIWEYVISKNIKTYGKELVQ